MIAGLILFAMVIAMAGLAAAVVVVGAAGGTRPPRERIRRPGAAPGE